MRLAVEFRRYPLGEHTALSPGSTCGKGDNDGNNRKARNGTEAIGGVERGKENGRMNHHYEIPHKLLLGSVVVSASDLQSTDPSSATDRDAARYRHRPSCSQGVRDDTAIRRLYWPKEVQ